MKLTDMRWRAFALLFWVCATAAASAEIACDADASFVPSPTERHFVALAAQRGVFYDGGGPAAVTLIKVNPAAQESETGAVGIYPDEDGRQIFGAVPPRVYDELLSDSGDPAEVLLRLEITAPQYERVLEVLRTWDRRARENVLLYPDLAMNTILFVKQATEALNRCADVIDLYVLDWGIEDRISDDNPLGLVPFLFFAEVKRRNAEMHVPDADMPEGLLLASGSAAETREAAR